MLRDLKISILALVSLTVLTGLVYPLAMTAIGRVLFPKQAGGSLVTVDGVVRGSELIGQSWTGDRWFHGRPSATGPVPYEARASSGSNLGPTAPALAEALTARSQRLRSEGVEGALPVDLLTASGSGLDPHISPDAARAQVGRVAAARGIPAHKVRVLVDEHVEGRAFGFLGEARVNVLELNLALDRLR
jgi:K+-transporting ATPase ATPase C chain